MNKLYYFRILGCILLGLTTKQSIYGQYIRPLTDEDKASLEGIIVEKYYQNDATTNIDTTGGALAKGAVTYRIYVDLKPGYTLQAVYGVPNHPLFFKTTTTFYNNTSNGQGSGDYIDGNKIANNTAAFDSWLTLGAATKSQYGILKTEDTDGSKLKIASLEKQDGLLEGKIKPVTYFGILPDFFSTNKASNIFKTDNGSWAVFGGISGPTEENKILIAQLTTDGEFSFEINLQVGTPKGGNANYVTRNPQTLEIEFPKLIYPVLK